MPRIVDSHCHLDFPDFDADLDQVIADALSAGVERMVTICTKLGALAKVRGIALTYAPVFFAAGTHPMSAATEPMVTVEDLMAVTRHPKMVGIGETGLDYHYVADSAAEQKTSFAVHIEAARQSGLPLIIHSRAADEDMADILRAEMANGPFSLVMHCFSSGEALAKTALDLGGYLSMSGVATFKKSQALRDIFATVPVERILVETDSPYLAPPPHRGKRNQPAYTALTAQTGANIFGLSLEDFAMQTTKNFDTLFAKAAAWKPA